MYWKTDLGDQDDLVFKGNLKHLQKKSILAHLLIYPLLVLEISPPRLFYLISFTLFLPCVVWELTMGSIYFHVLIET